MVGKGDSTRNGGRARRFYWRIVPLILLTLILTAAMDMVWSFLRYPNAVEGWGVLLIFLVLGQLAAAGMMGLLILLPASIIWFKLFNGGGLWSFVPRLAALQDQNLRPTIRRRAVWASLKTGIITTLAVLAYLVFKQPQALELVPRMALSVVIFMVLTWVAFRGLPEAEIGRRE